MKFRSFVGSLLTLFLASTLAMTLYGRPFEAELGTIYIRSDGSVDPPTAHISSIDNISYSLINNVYESIIVEKDNIVVDGAGHILKGTGVYASKGISLSGRSNVTIKNMTIEAFYYGIYLYDSSGNNMCENSITANNWYGVWLNSSSNNSICENSITRHNWYGITLENSSNNRISANNIANNHYGIHLSKSSNNNRISGNTIKANDGCGVFIEDSSQNIIYINEITANSLQAIWLYFSSNNRISGNNIANNYCGIRLSASFGNSISGNNIANNYCGIRLSASSNNELHHNNFIENNEQVNSTDSLNTWDNGVKGNYWSNYTGVDLYSGPYQNETGSDGIGDTPYVIDENNRDRYPFVRSTDVSPGFSISLTTFYALIIVVIVIVATVTFFTIRKRSPQSKKHLETST